MRILFTADWHIKLGQKNVPKAWAIDRYRQFFEKIHALEDDVDLHVISGDIFDRVPTLDELSLYGEFIAGVWKPTIVTSGNHESETKKKSFLRHLAHWTNKTNPNVWIALEVNTVDYWFDFEDSPKFYIVPYEFIKDEKTWEKLEPLPVMTHVRGEIPPHVKPEIPLEWLEKFPVVFAGDLHSHQNTQRNIIYPGSPMTTSFHRNETKNTNGYLIIDTDDWSWTWHDFNLPQLIRKTVSSKDEMVPSDYHHTIYELEGTMDELAGKVDSELLDKKIVKRTSDVSMRLEDKMSLEEELEHYLKTILQIEDVSSIMTVYHEFNKIQED